MLSSAMRSQLGFGQLQYLPILLQIVREKKGIKRPNEKKFYLNRQWLFFVCVSVFLSPEVTTDCCILELEETLRISAIYPLCLINEDTDTQLSHIN